MLGGGNAGIWGNRSIAFLIDIGSAGEIQSGDSSEYSMTFLIDTCRLGTTDLAFLTDTCQLGMTGLCFKHSVGREVARGLVQ